MRSGSDSDLPQGRSTSVAKIRVFKLTSDRVTVYAKVSNGKRILGIKQVAIRTGLNEEVGRDHYTTALRNVAQELHSPKLGLSEPQGAN